MQIETLYEILFFLLIFGIIAILAVYLGVHLKPQMDAVASNSTGMNCNAISCSSTTTTTTP